MKRYLLFDSGCSRCMSIARQIERMANGNLVALSLRAPEVQELLNHVRPGWKWEPMLVEDMDGIQKAFSGHSMMWRLVSILGLRKTLEIMNLTGKYSSQMVSPIKMDRRSLLRTAGAIVTSAFALAIPGISKAAGEKPQLPDANRAGGFNIFVPTISNGVVGTEASFSAEEQATLLGLVRESDIYQENKQFLSFSDVVRIPNQSDWAMVVQADVAQGVEVPKHMLLSFVNAKTKAVADQFVFQIDQGVSKTSDDSFVITGRYNGNTAEYTISNGKIISQNIHHIRRFADQPNDTGGIACGLVCGSIPIVYCWMTGPYAVLCDIIFLVVCSFTCG